jgi:hypothetical protein
MKIAARKRGPRKDDGGRQSIKIYDDADRWIIETARWFRKDDPKEQRAKALLQALDFLFTAHDCIEVTAEIGKFSLTNTTPLRSPTANSPARRLHSAPGRTTLLKSRVQNLQEKIIRFQLTRPDKKENLWTGRFHLGLDFLAHGEAGKGFVLLTSIGFDLPESARNRFVKIFHAINGEAKAITN